MSKSRHPSAHNGAAEPASRYEPNTRERIYPINTVVRAEFAARHDVIAQFRGSISDPRTPGSVGWRRRMASPGVK